MIVIGGKVLAAPGLEQPGPPQEAPPAPPQPPVAASVAIGSLPELRDDSQGNDVGQGFGDDGKRQPPAHPEPLPTATEVIGGVALSAEGVGSEQCRMVVFACHSLERRSTARLGSPAEEATQ